MEDVPLVEVDGDEGLKLPALNLGEGLCGHIDEDVQDVQEFHVSGVHDLPVRAGVVESNFGIPCPEKLDAQNSYLLYTEVQMYVELCVQSSPNFSRLLRPLLDRGITHHLSVAILVPTWYPSSNHTRGC